MSKPNENIESKTTEKKLTKQEKKELLLKIDERVIALRKIPQPPQRTAEWYDFRNQRLTSSDWGTIISGSKFASRRKIIKKKCNKEQSKMLSGKAIQWGVKYEDVAVKIYEKNNNTHVLEFGCLPHPKIPFLGASPDGITIEGIMLEIKCPYSRKITGIPLESYWVQVQGQLEICDLEFCDFFECKLLEYDTQTEYLEDTTSEYKGCVLVFMDENLSYKYCYSKLNISEKKLEKWIKKKTEKYTTERKLTYIEKTFWFLENSSCVRIKRDRDWFNNTALPKLSSFWDIILDVRKHPEKLNDSTSSPQSSDGEKPDYTYEPLQEGVCLFKDTLQKNMPKRKNNKIESSNDNNNDNMEECLFDLGVSKKTNNNIKKEKKEKKCKKEKKIKKTYKKEEDIDECLFDLDVPKKNNNNIKKEKKCKKEKYKKHYKNNYKIKKEENKNEDEVCLFD